MPNPSRKLQTRTSTTQTSFLRFTVLLLIVGLAASAKLVMAQDAIVEPASVETESEIVTFTTKEDYLDMQKQLGITKLRPGPSGNPSNPNAANTDESKANPYPNLPDLMMFGFTMFMPNGDDIDFGDRFKGFGPPPGGDPPAKQQLVEAGWGYVTINVPTIQDDSGGEQKNRFGPPRAAGQTGGGLTRGIIGLRCVRARSKRRLQH